MLEDCLDYVWWVGCLNNNLVTLGLMLGQVKSGYYCITILTIIVSY